MRLIAVHTCPLWEDLAAGTRTPAMEPADVPDPGRVAGWVNVLDMVIDDQPRLLLVGPQAAR